MVRISSASWSTPLEVWKEHHAWYPSENKHIPPCPTWGKKITSSRSSSKDVMGQDVLAPKLTFVSYFSWQVMHFKASCVENDMWAALHNLMHVGNKTLKYAHWILEWFFFGANHKPYHPCKMAFQPRFGWWFMVNVGKYTIRMDAI